MIKTFDERTVNEIVKQFQDLFEKQKMNEIEAKLIKGEYKHKKLNGKMEKKTAKAIIYELTTKIKLQPYDANVRKNYVQEYGAGLVDDIDAFEWDKDFE
jgi:hypothetical protein